MGTVTDGLRCTGSNWAVKKVAMWGNQAIQVDALMPGALMESDLKGILCFSCLPAYRRYANIIVASAGFALARFASFENFPHGANKTNT